LILLKYYCLPIASLSEYHPVLDRPDRADDFAPDQPPAKQRCQVPVLQDDKKSGAGDRNPKCPPGNVQGENAHGEQAAGINEKKFR
jgi:hypothetical protein